MAICGSRGVILLCLAMISLLVMCMNFEGTDARVLGYGAIQHDITPGCSPVHPENCVRKASNPFVRNCEQEERCRSDRLGGDDEETDDDNVEVVDSDCDGDGDGGKTQTFKIDKFKNVFPKFDPKVELAGNIGKN